MDSQHEQRRPDGIAFSVHRNRLSIGHKAVHKRCGRAKRLQIYYSNSCASFRLLLMGGDVETNPGPDGFKTSRTIKNVRVDKLNENRNLITIKPEHKRLNKVKSALWNAHSVNKKAAPICDFIIAKHIDILATTETWLTARDFNDNNSIAEILNTLRDFDFHHIPRLNRTGGGVGVFLRKGFKVTTNDCLTFSSMEYLDLGVSHGNSTIRLLTVYRPPRSKKNKETPNSFLNDFFNSP